METRMKAVVIGYGNTLRGDDAVGPLLAEAVERAALPRTIAIAVSQLTPELAEFLADASVVVFVDAAIDTKEGAVAVQPLQAAAGRGPPSHTSDPAGLLALAEALYGRCPPAWIVGVPAMSFDIGAELTPCARRGMEEALREVRGLVAASTCTQPF
jgi:hydrogenase maturation protease